MYKYCLIVLYIVTISFSQATIPVPTEIANFTKKTFPDDSAYTDRYIYSVSNYIPGINNAQNIDDFDGDGSDEIYITWRRYLMRHRVNKIDSTVDEWEVPYDQSCVFSTKKSTYLINGPFATQWSPPSLWPSTVITGDFTGDGCIDFLIGDKVYSTSTPIVKKKHP